MVIIYWFIIFGYCLGWIIYSGFYFVNGDEKWFIYLINWGFIFVILYYIWVIVVSIFYYCGVISIVVGMEMKVIGNRDVEGEEGLGVNDFEELLVSMFWYYKSLWVIFNMVVNFFILIIFLYWILVFGGKISGLDVIIYLLNCIFMLVDLMFSLIFV